jgi:hypothetical protein
MEKPMLKRIVATAVTAALLFAPVAAFADESTTPPSPDTVKTPGNGPDVMPKHRHHHHHHHHSMMKKPAADTMDKPADAPKN